MDKSTPAIFSFLCEECDSHLVIDARQLIVSYGNRIYICPYCDSRTGVNKKYVKQPKSCEAVEMLKKLISTGINDSNISELSHEITTIIKDWERCK